MVIDDSEPWFHNCLCTFEVQSDKIFYCSDFRTKMPVFQHIDTKLCMRPVENGMVGLILCMKVWKTQFVNYSLSWLKGPCGGCKIQEMSFHTLTLTLTPPPLRNFLALELNRALQNANYNAVQSCWVLRFRRCGVKLAGGMGQRLLAPQLLQ